MNERVTSMMFCSQVVTMMCGTCSNENAMKMMFMKYMDTLRQGQEFTQVDLGHLEARPGVYPGRPWTH